MLRSLQWKILRYIGRAMLDFMERTRTGAREELKPVKKENISRVFGSAALKMYDHYFISLPRSVADQGTPILINNACCSWHRLAADYTFGNARAYIGTLFPVTTSEAHDVVVKLLSKHFGKPLPAALWSAQREVYGDNLRRPYVLTGVYTQRLRVGLYDVPAHIQSRLTRSLDEWKKGAATMDQQDKQSARKFQETVVFYERELAHFRKRRMETLVRASP
jgi:hypothetical protein